MLHFVCVLDRTSAREYDDITMTMVFGEESDTGGSEASWPVSRVPPGTFSSNLSSSPGSPLARSTPRFTSYTPTKHTPSPASSDVSSIPPPLPFTNPPYYSPIVRSFDGESLQLPGVKSPAGSLSPTPKSIFKKETSTSFQKEPTRQLFKKESTVLKKKDIFVDKPVERPQVEKSEVEKSSFT